MEFFHKVTRFPFMNTRRVWYGLSALLIISSIAAGVCRHLNLGVDFTGGVVVETEFLAAAERRRAARCLGQGRRRQCPSADLRQLPRYLVRLPPDPNAKGDQIGARIKEIFSAADPKVKLQRTEVVGPQVGQELFVKGGIALAATLVFIMVYVLFRFTLKLALGAILAVLHDPICVVGFFALTQTTFDLTAICGHPRGDRLLAQ